MFRSKQFAKDTSGATAIEYGLLAALVAVALITAVTAVGGTLADREPAPVAESTVGVLATEPK